VRIDRSAKEPYTTVEVLESLEDLSFRGESVVVQRYGEKQRGAGKALRREGRGSRGNTHLPLGAP